MKPPSSCAQTATKRPSAVIATAGWYCWRWLLAARGKRWPMGWPPALKRRPKTRVCPVPVVASHTTAK